MLFIRSPMHDEFMYDIKKYEPERWDLGFEGVRRTPSRKERMAAKAARRQQRISRKRNRK